MQNLLYETYRVRACKNPPTTFLNTNVRRFTRLSAFGQMPIHRPYRNRLRDGSDDDVEGGEREGGEGGSRKGGIGEQLLRKLKAKRDSTDRRGIGFTPQALTSALPPVPPVKYNRGGVSRRRTPTAPTTATPPVWRQTAPKPPPYSSSLFGPPPGPPTGLTPIPPRMAQAPSTLSWPPVSRLSGEGWANNPPKRG